MKTVEDSPQPSPPRRRRKLSRFNIRGAHRRRSVKVPVEWDTEAGCWMMTPASLRTVEKAKLVLMFEEWVDACEWGPSKLGISADLRKLASQLESLSRSIQPTPPASPARLGELASRLREESDPILVRTLRDEMVRGFYGDPAAV